jgi:tripartite-type tricarboxylate transporter receptor subunit TctC
VIVGNKLGAGSRIAALAVKNAPTGQNVLILANPAGMVIGPLLYKDAGYDPITDFTAVSTVNLFIWPWPCPPRCRCENSPS